MYIPQRDNILLEKNIRSFDVKKLKIECIFAGVNRHNGSNRFKLLCYWNCQLFAFYLAVCRSSWASLLVFGPLS